MTGIEEREISPVSAADTDGGRSETDDLDQSSASITSVASTTALRVSFDLHRHNTRLLREKQEMEHKHDSHILALRGHILELEYRISQLMATSNVDAEKTQALHELVHNLTEENGRLVNDLDQYRAASQKHIGLDEESAKLKAALLEQNEENNRKGLELTDLKHQVSDLQTELKLKNEEISCLRQSITDDPKAAEIVKLKQELGIRDQRILDLSSEREADSARMQSVKDVQMAHEALRRQCQEKQTHIQHLEEVLDQTIREKAQLSSDVMKMREQIQEKGERLDRLEENLNEFKINAERQYEDTCQQYTAQINALRMASYGAAEYPGKLDNVCPTNDLSQLSVSGKDFVSAINHSESYVAGTRYVEYGSTTTHSESNCQRCEIWDLLTAESLRTIETLRGEYEIEVRRNAQLQQENDRLMADWERLKRLNYI